MQPGPGSHRDHAIAVVPGGELTVWGGPGGGFLAVEPGAVAAGPAQPARGTRRRVGIEHPVTLDPYQDLCPVAAQLIGQGDRIIPAVEGKQRHRRGAPQPGNQIPDLPSGGLHRVLPRRDPAAVRRPGPRITIKVQLTDLLVPPARHDRLARAMPRRVIVIPPARGGLRITPRPAGAIDREHQRPRPRPRRGQQILQRLHVDRSPCQRRIHAAMTAPEHRLQRQPRQRAHRPARAQHGVRELEQRIRPRPCAPIPPGNETPPAAAMHRARLVHPAPTTPYWKPRPPPLSECLVNLEDEAVAALMPEQTANKLALQVKTKAKLSRYPREGLSSYIHTR